MDAEEDPEHALYVYLSTVGGLSILIVLMLLALYGRGIPQLTSGFLLDPAGTVRADPVSVVLLAGIFVAILVLFVIIVLFGVKYEQAAPENTLE